MGFTLIIPPVFWFLPVSSLYFNINGTQSPDFNPFAVGKRVGHLIEKYVHNRGSLLFCNIEFAVHCIDEVLFCHGFLLKC